VLARNAIRFWNRAWLSAITPRRRR
jgi:hypothetical protein